MVAVRVADADPESTLAGEDDTSALVVEQIGIDTPYHLETVSRSEWYSIYRLFWTGL